MRIAVLAPVRPALALAPILAISLAIGLAAPDAAAQNPNTDETRALYERAISYCNSVGWRYQNCIDARRTVEQSCANSVLGYCELAAQIDDGAGRRGFPDRPGTVSGVTAIEPIDTPPTPLAPLAPANPPALQQIPPPPAGDDDDRSFDDVLQGLTN